MKMCLKAADTPRCEEVEVSELNKADDVLVLVLAGSFERFRGVDSQSGYESLCERDVLGVENIRQKHF